MKKENISKEFRLNTYIHKKSYIIKELSQNKLMSKKNN